MENVRIAAAVLLITAGLVTAAVGLLLLFFHKFPLLGNLPGDISFKGKHVSVYIPLATAILVSVFFTLLVNGVLFVLRRLR